MARVWIRICWRDKREQVPCAVRVFFDGLTIQEFLGIIELVEQAESLGAIPAVELPTGELPTVEFPVDEFQA